MKMIRNLALLFLLSSPAWAQHTTVTAQVKDPIGALYRTCSGSASFVGQNTTPGAGPYLLGGSVFQTVVPITCDSSARFTVSISDNNQITPTPSQWRFSLCTAFGVFSGPPICFNALVTITGTSQNVTAALQAAAAPLPPYAPFLETNGVLNGSQSLLNLVNGSNITIIDDGHGNVTISSSGGGGGGGGGGGLPDPGSNGVVVRTALNTTAAIPNAAVGAYYVSTGTGTLPITQTKAIYDTRDWMTCDGSTDGSAGMNLLLSTIGTNEATIRFIGTTTSTASCRIGNTFFPQNVTLDFSGGGAFKLISSSTSIGGGNYISGTSVECGAGTTCSLPAFSVTTGNTLFVMEAPYPGFNPNKTLRVTDNCGNFYIHVFQSLNNQTRNQGAWIASSVTGGSCTITATTNNSVTTHMMAVAQVSGMGPVTSLDTSASNNNSGTTMSSGSTTTLTGAFLLAFGGQPFTSETCTAGAGYTQPASLAGQSASGFMCAEYRNVSAGGSTSATQTISVDPSPGFWVYSLLSLKPGNATATIWGGIIDPDQHQIFYNADSQTGHGVIDFTGSTITMDVYPEWWGATSNDTVGTTNTPALQAAIWAAFGGGLTQARTNASGLSIYNRPLRIGSQYTINDELKMFDVLGFRMYGVNRLSSGIVQAATNKRIINAQSVAYGEVSDMSFSTQASQNAALFDLDWDGVSTPGDLKPQFVDFNRDGFIGNGAGFIGLEIAKSGGAAQGSNIYCRDCAAAGFTEACYQVGTHAAPATNALDIGISGDVQSCKKNGIAVYGGGYVSFGGAVEEASMENGFDIVNNVGTQTGFDMYCEVTQGPCSMDYMRSESRRLISGTDIVLRKSRMINQANYLPPGQTFPVGAMMTGTTVGGDGAYYTVTANAGVAGGVGTPTATLTPSSGTATTLTDTNQTIAGSVTIKLFTSGDVITQAVTGSTGTVLGAATSTATVTGTLTSGACNGSETMLQAVTGITGTELFPTPSNTGPVPLSMNNLSGTADNSHTWTGQTSGCVYTPNAAPTFSASSMLITASTGAPDNNHNWTNPGGATFVPTGAPTNQANFTVNAFTGFLVSVLTGKNAGCYGTVTSNTATVITFSAGWTTRYAKLGCPFPDTSSSFVVEPGWNHGTVVSGGMTMVYNSENAIDCQTSFGSQASCTPSGRLEDVIIAGGKVRVNANNSLIDNLSVYRQDWYDNSGGGSPQGCCEMLNVWNVSVAATITTAPVPYQGTFLQSWNLPSITGVSYSGANQWRLGSKALVFDIGNIGVNNPPSNTSANSVWVGGRSDSGAGTDTTRNILEFGGMLGRGAPLPSASNSFNTANQPGTDTDITGGPSTGNNANGGAVNFWTSTPGGAGTTVNSGLKRWLISAAGHFFAGLDNTYDIGAVAANRPRTIYAATSVIAPTINASALGGATFAAPGPIGSTTPSTGAFSSTTVGDGSFGSLQTNAPSACETTFGITTLNTGATTTDTGLNCLPANAVIDAVLYRITTTITTSASFTIGDATTAGRFCGTQSTLTAGTIGTCFVQADQTGSPGPRQVSAAKVRVTLNANPGAGAVRLIVYYHTWTPPTS